MVTNEAIVDSIPRIGRITQTELETIHGAPARIIRKQIAAMRREGIPICSDGRGYWYSHEDAVSIIEMLVGRAQNMMRTAMMVKKKMKERHQRELAL